MTFAYDNSPFSHCVYQIVLASQNSFIGRPQGCQRIHHVKSTFAHFLISVCYVDFYLMYPFPEMFCACSKAGFPRNVCHILFCLRRKLASLIYKLLFVFVSVWMMLLIEPLNSIWLVIYVVHRSNYSSSYIHHHLCLFSFDIWAVYSRYLMNHKVNTDTVQTQSLIGMLHGS